MFRTSPGLSISGRFRSIIDLLCHGLAEHAVRDWTATAFVQIIVATLRRRLHRFEALKARFDAGLPPPRPRPVRKRPTAGDAVCERSFDFMPRERGWLFRTTEQDGAASFGQLRDLLAEPKMAAFIAADPRVGRLLRPLWWMLSPKLGLPKALRPPPPPAVASTAEATPSARRVRPASLPGSPKRLIVRVVRMPAVLRPGSDPPVAA